MGQLINTPRGTIEFPDGMGREEISSILNKEFAPKEPTPTLLEAGWEGLKGDVRTGGAKLAEVVGFPEWSKSMGQQAEGNYATAAKRPTMSLADVKDWTDYPKMIYEGAVQSLPSMAPVLAGAGAGALVGGPLGALAGGALGAFPQFAGANLTEQMQENKIPLEKTDAAMAAGTAVLQSLADSAANVFTLGMGKIASPLLRMVGKEASEKLLVRMALRATEGGVAEGLSEGTQQALQIAQANPGKLWEFGPEVQNEIATAAVVGAGMGGALGGGAGALRKPAQSAAPGAAPSDPSASSDPLRIEHVISQPPWMGPTPENPFPPGSDGGPPGDAWTPNKLTTPNVPFPPPGGSATPQTPPTAPTPPPEAPVSPSIQPPDQTRAGPLEAMFNDVGPQALDHLVQTYHLNRNALESLATHYSRGGSETPEQALTRAWNSWTNQSQSQPQAPSPPPVQPLSPPPAASPPVQATPKALDGEIIPPGGQIPRQTLPSTSPVKQMLKSFKTEADLDHLHTYLQATGLTSTDINDIAKTFDLDAVGADKSPLMAFIIAKQLRDVRKEAADATRVFPPPSKPVPKPAKATSPGQQVHDAAFQMMAGKMPAPQVLANAKLMRSFFEEMGRRMGTDAAQEWKQAGIDKVYGPEDQIDPGWFGGDYTGPDGTLNASRLRGAAQWKTNYFENKVRIALGKASPSTMMHEVMHIRFELMRQNAKVNPEEAYDFKQLLDYVGKTHSNEITREDHEKIARGFQHYLEYGEAPTAGLRGVFEKIKKWLLDHFKTAQDHNVPMTDAAMKTYARLLGGTEGRPTKTSSAQAFSQVNREGVPVAPGHMREGLVSRVGDGKVGESFNDNFNEGTTLAEDIQEGLLSRLKTKTNAIFNKVTDPLGNLPGKRDYMVKRMLTQGKADEINKLAKEMIEPLNKGDPASMKQVYDYLTTRAASAGMITDDKARAAAMQIKAKIGQISRDLVASGKMSTASAADFHDRYLPRLYLKYLIEKKGMKASGIKVSNEDYLRQRQDLSPEERKALGEVKDPRFLAGVAITRPTRDLAVHDFLRQISTNPEWTWQESLVNWNGKMVTPYYLKDEASDIRERAAKYATSEQEKTELRAIADKMDEAAAQNNPKNDAYDPKLFARLPMSKSYGDLRGAVVRKEIASDIKGMESFSDPNNFMERWLGDRSSKLVKLNSLWKESKVVWNPATQVRNFVSNLIALHLSGVPVHRIPQLLVQSAKDISSDGKYWNIAKKYGIASSTMTENELRQNTDKFLKTLEGLNQGPAKASFSAIMRAANRLREGAGSMYQTSEYLGKTLKIIDAMERQGISEADAALAANDALFDYSLVHPSIRYLRNAPLGMPFVTYTTKVLPFLMKTTATPRGALRMAGYAALAQSLPYLVAQMNDIDRDDVETLRKSLSEQLRKRGDLYLLPFKDDNGRWQFADLGYFFPWQQVMDFGRGARNLNPSDMAQSIGILSSPTVAIIAALKTNIDSFTGQKIADERDPPSKQARSILSFVWGQIAPPVFTQYGAVGKALEAKTGTGLNRYGEAGLGMGQILSGALGANVRPVLPDQQRQRNVMAMQNDINAEKTRMNQQLRDQSISPEKRQGIIKEYQEDIRYRYEKMLKYVAETQPSPRLSAATNRKD